MALSATWTSTPVDPSDPNYEGTQQLLWVDELGIFVSIGSVTHAGISADGTTWTFYPLPGNAQWTSVAWSPSLGLLCAVANDSGIVNVALSEDGITWISGGVLSFEAGAITWAESLGLFVSCSRANAGTTTDRFMTSPDGTNWTVRTGPNIRFGSITWSPDLSLFVAFGSGGGAANIATSSNGTLWTSRSFPEVASVIDDGGPQIVWADTLNLFVGLAQPASLGFPSIVTSPNGITWTFRDNPDEDETNQAEFESLCWVKRVTGPSFLAALGFSSSVDAFVIMTSSDAISWTWATPDANLANLETIAYSPALDGIICGGLATTSWGFPMYYAAVYANRGNPAGWEGEAPYQVTIVGDNINGGFLVSADDDHIGYQQIGSSRVMDVFFDNDIDDDFPGIDPETFESSLRGLNYWAATNVTVVNEYTLTCIPPPGKGMTTVVVQGWAHTLNGQHSPHCLLAYMPATTFADFTYEDPAILSSLPATGNAGDVVTITSEFLYDYGTQELNTSSAGPDGFTKGQVNPNHRISVVFDDLTEIDIDPEDVNVISDTSMTIVMPYHLEGTGAVVGFRFQPSYRGYVVGGLYGFVYDEMTLLAQFTYTAQQWGIDALGYYGTDSIDPPSDDIEFPWPEWEDDTYYPPFTIYDWDEVTDPLETGWWHSINEAFAGTGIVIYNGRPKAPRGFGKLSPYATGSAGMMGGFPGPSAVLNNRMIYAENAYTDVPIIRIFNGALDRELVRVPKTAALATPIAVVSMLAANNTIYFSTLDSGTTSANWTGRVFSLDPVSATLTLLGAAFGSGQVPYALAWHMGRLWCGTNSADPAVTGNVYFIRPGIDTTWTTDEAISAHTNSGVTSMLSFEGKLYVGTSAAAATRAKVLVRDSLGAYTTSDTGTGGAAAAANNCFPALTSFQGSLYNSYWNPTAPLVSLIRKMTAGVWATVYTGSGTTLKPFVAFPQDDDVLLAVGGGLTYDVGLARTIDGTTWTNATTFLQQFAPASTGLPAFGVLKR